MSKYILDKGWKFHDGDIPAPIINSHTKTYMAAKAGGAIGAASPDFDKSNWQDVDLPHDYAVKNKFDEQYGPANGYKKRGKAWYSKRFKLEQSDRDKQILIEFEGVTGECTVWLNGSVIGRNFSGYNSFTVDATDMALYGDNVNDLVVYVNADIIEGWWYEGAGIYRHVNLYKKNKLHFEHNGIFYEPVKVDASVWQVFTHINVENITTEEKAYNVEVKLFDDEDNVIGTAVGGGTVYPGCTSLCDINFLTYSPKLWDIDSPTLYKTTATLKDGDTIIDEETINIGFRTISVDAEKGFFLNGRHVRLLGTCNHQDHAGIGVAVPDSVNEYRIKLLKEMGSNAYRAAHGNASKAVLEACDKYGILVMDENRQYNTAQTDGLKQIRDMVMRDRNHPSVIMYSLYNEEPLQGTFTGRKLAQRMKNEVEKFDGTRFTLGAMNNGLLSTDGAYDVCDITGINYQTHMYDEFHNKFPYLPVTGSENCSAFMTRGCYKTDHNKNVIDEFDSEAAPWGNTYRDGFKQINDRNYFLGYFIWTGFDYRGEPTPFAYPSISTQFGIMDTCGFPKSAYYLNKSYWTDEPVIHIISHWNYSDGDKVNIQIFSNCSNIELFVNDKLIGKGTPDDTNTLIFENVPFEKGFVKAVSSDGKAEDTVYTCGKLANFLTESGFDCVFENDAVCINVTAVDENNRYVFDCDETVRFKVDGGRVLGVGNGNPNSHEDDIADFRKLFAGKAQAVVAPNENSEKITVTVYSDTGISSSIKLPVIKRDNAPKNIPSVSERYVTKWRQTLELSDEYPDYKKEISDSDMNTWVVVSVGDGYDDIFNDRTGYEMYKTTAEIHCGEKLIFRELFGDRADVYINNEQVLSRECKYGNRFEYKADKDGKIDITVIIKSENQKEPAGISKSVVISN